MGREGHEQERVDTVLNQRNQTSAAAFLPPKHLFSYLIKITVHYWTAEVTQRQGVPLLCLLCLCCTTETQSRLRCTHNSK